MNNLVKKLNNRFLIIVFIIAILCIIASGSNNNEIVTANPNTVKSIEAVHIVNKYNSLLETTKPTMVSSFEQVLSIAPSKSVAFHGSMTAYGPDCKGCGGKTGCPPRQNVTNGNIYFNDNDYGKVRIVASSSAIPCGTMLRISNLSISKEPIYAIVLDRGSAIQGTKMDLLYKSEATAISFGRQSKVLFEVLRWGW